MFRLDRHIHEAVHVNCPHIEPSTSQLSLGLTPCFIESLGFLQICQLTDVTRRAISHQYRMVYREEFNLWYETISAYLRDRHVPVPIRSFLTDASWNNQPLQIDQYWFPNMHEVIFLTYIIEKRGYPVWTDDRCEAFYYRSGKKKNGSKRIQRLNAEFHSNPSTLHNLFSPSQVIDNS